MKSMRLTQSRSAERDNIFFGEVSGRVNVGTEGPPDGRLTADKGQAASEPTSKNVNEPRPSGSKKPNSGFGTRARPGLIEIIFKTREAKHDAELRNCQPRNQNELLLS
jgi:hypothetical protein